MKTFRKKIFASAAVLTALIIASPISCSGQKEPPRDTSNDYPIELRAAQTSEEVAPYTIDFTGQICILFGDGFNSPEFVEATMEKLNQEYGTGETGDIFFPVIYPDDLKNKIMNLRDRLNEKDISGLILLGAPSGTHNMLFFLNTYWEDAIPYPIFSYCPKDDIDGQEAWCNMVIDCLHNSAASDSEEYAAYIKDLVPNFLKGTLNYILTMKDPLQRDADLLEHARYILGDQSITRYVDPATGLSAMKHFVIGNSSAQKEEAQLGSTILLDEADQEGPSLSELEG